MPAKEQDRDSHMSSGRKGKSDARVEKEKRMLDKKAAAETEGPKKGSEKKKKVSVETPKPESDSSSEGGGRVDELLDDAAATCPRRAGVVGEDAPPARQTDGKCRGVRASVGPSTVLSHPACPPRACRAPAPQKAR